MAASTLVNVLHAYDVQFERHHLKAALQLSEYSQELERWVKDQLGDDNLLTKDEITLFSNLEKTGDVNKIASHDLASTLSLRQWEIEAAIEQLNGSTAAINKQAEVLRQQHEAFSRLTQTRNKKGDVRSAIEAEQLQKWVSECKSLNSMATSVGQSVERRIASLEHSALLQESPPLYRSLDVLLESDDKLLASLQKLGLELETDNPEEEENVEKLREVCIRLIKFSVETIRTKLDRVFVQSIYEAQRSGRKMEASLEEEEALVAEVESLFTEIFTVAQMSVEQQYLDPAMRSLSEKNAKSVTRTLEAVTYIDRCLDYILDHISRFSARVAEYQDHQYATAAILTVAKEEIAKQIEHPIIPSTVEGAACPSPTRRRRSSGGISPVRHRIIHQKSTWPFEGSGAPPLDTILDHLALSLVPDEPAIPVTPGPNTVPHMNVAHTNPVRASQVTIDHIRYAAAALTERTKKTADLNKGVQDAVESGTSVHLMDARRAVQLLRDELLAETPYGKVNLMDPEIEGSMAVLKQEVEKAKDRTATIETIMSVVRNSEKRDGFVARWGVS